MKLNKLIAALVASVTLTIAHAQTFLTNGLVAYYQFNGNANDATGNGNNGTPTNAAWGTNRFGASTSCLSLAASGYVSTSFLPPTGTASRTFTGWFFTPTNSGLELFFEYGGTQPIGNVYPADRMALEYDGTSLILDVDYSVLVANAPSLAGGWHQFALVSSSGSSLSGVQLFVDGVQKSTSITTGPNAQINTSATMPLSIGGFPVGSQAHASGTTDAGLYFNGRLDDFRIYNRALSSTEVTQLFSTEADSPVISQQPTNQTANVGDTVSFSVTASTSSTPLSYQWLKDGLPISGATNSTLTLSNVQNFQIGYYNVILGNGISTVSSTQVTLNLNGYAFNLWQGLAAYYPFSGNANDASGNGINGTNNGAVLAQDRFGLTSRAFSFNGLNNNIAFPKPPINQLDNWAMTAWINPAILGQAGSVVGLGYEDNITGNGYSMNISSGGSTSVGNHYGFLFGGVRWQDTGYAFPSTNRWYQIAATRNSGITTFYVNGVRLTTTTTTTPTAPTDFHIGSQNGVRYFIGSIDDVRIYSHGLSSNDMAQLYLVESTSPVPVIVTNLSNVNALLGSTVTFAPSVTGTAPIAYQWFFTNTNNQPSAGAYAQTVAGFVYGAVVTNGGAGYYDVPNVKFTGGGGSGAAGYASVSNGMVISITVTNAGTGYSSVPTITIDPPDGFILGQTNSTLVVSNVDTSSLGNYFVIATNSYGSVTSSVANIILVYPPTFATPPADIAIPLKGTGMFSAVAAGTAPLRYQWKFGTNKLANATNSTLILTNFSTNLIGSYTLTITNLYGQITSSPVQALLAPSITAPFNGAIGLWGQGATLSVGAIGSGMLQYQWYFNGVAIDGATSNTLMFDSVQFTNAGLYSVVVSSPYGSTTNTPYQLVVNPANVGIGVYPGVAITGTIGYTYTIQATTDLSDTNAWVTATNVTLIESPQIWSDYSTDLSKAGTAKKFYRVIAGQ